MTKETKVGLLVGLTFIILFAIILSEKGAKNVPPSGLTIADAGHVDSEIEIPTTRQPLAADGAFPVEPALTSIRPTYRTRSSGPIMLEEEEQIGQPIPGVNDVVPALPDSVIARLNMPPMSETPLDLGNDNQYGPQPGDDTVSFQEAVARATRRSPESSPSLLIERDPEEDLAKSDDTAPIPAFDLQPTQPVEMRPKVIATHEVQAGESLSKIASKYFGRSTPSRVNAIFDVNRDVLESVNSVRAGDVLKIPGLNAEGTVAFVAADDFAPAKIVNASPKPVDDGTPRMPISNIKDRPVDTRLAGRTSTENREFLWYQVQERDTLSGISQRELGSTRHYLKIYKLNKDILPDKNTLKPGIKIRLPIMQQDTTPPSGQARRSSNSAPQGIVNFASERPE